MARLFLGDDALPKIQDVRDVYAHAGEIRARGLPVAEGEARLLKQLVWCMLQVQNDQEEGPLHTALARFAALVLAITEDDEVSITDAMGIGGRLGLEGLAVQVGHVLDQVNLTLGVAMGVGDLGVRGATDVPEIYERIPQPQRTVELQRVVRQATTHLRQGERLLAGQSDPERAQRHRSRLRDAYTHTTLLLARLLGTPAANDNGSLRQQIVRRELKQIEVDALGAERISEAEQAREARRLLAWTQEDMGETLTDTNKAELAARLREATTEQPEPNDDEDDGDWLFGMD